MVIKLGIVRQLKDRINALGCSTRVYHSVVSIRLVWRVNQEVILMQTCNQS